MFGHADDNSYSDNNHSPVSAPSSDGILGRPNPAPHPAPAHDDSAPNNDAPSAPAANDDLVQDLMNDESSAADDSAIPTPPSPAPQASDDDLLDIKQQALQQLSPLVHQLDQTPEEKFRTTMMLIQAADNQGLLKDAYDAAQAISDEKVRAQALLDVVNEINYFTQHHDEEAEQSA